MTTEESIRALDELLRRDERVAAAIVFGSVAKGLERRGSDVDVALIAQSDAAAEMLRGDWMRLVGELSIAARRDVQLVILEHAGATLAFQALKHGRVLFDRNPERTADVREKVLLAWFDAEHHRRILRESIDARVGAGDG